MDLDEKCLNPFLFPAICQIVLHFNLLNSHARASMSKNMRVRETEKWRKKTKIQIYELQLTKSTPQIIRKFIMTSLVVSNLFRLFFFSIYLFISLALAHTEKKIINSNKRRNKCISTLWKHLIELRIFTPKIKYSWNGFILAWIRIKEKFNHFLSVFFALSTQTKRINSSNKRCFNRTVCNRVHRY